MRIHAGTEHPRDDLLNENVATAAAIADATPSDIALQAPGSTAAAQPSAVTRTSLTSVQALRGCAILLVVLHHLLFYMIYRRSGKAPDESVLKQFPVLVEFAFGVDLFFVLSGFLLMLIAKPYLERRRTIANFALHRILRIWPLYVSVTCFVLAREYIKSSLHGDPLPGDFQLARLAGLFFIPSFNGYHQLGPIYQAAWTLSYEVWFYGCFALALTMATNRRELMIGLAAIVFGGMVIGNNLPDGSVGDVFLSSPIVVEFLFGAWICFQLQSGRRLPFPASWWLIAGLLWLFAFAQINVEEGWRLGTRGVPAALIVVAVLKLEGVARFPAMLVAVGNASYSVFLSHDLVLPRFCETGLRLLEGIVPDVYLGESAAILAFLPTVLVGMLVFRFIEKPLNRKTKEWIGN